MVFIEPRESAEATEALKEFVSLPSKKKSGIMFAVCGGKWSEGLDYRGDQMTAAMVIGGEVSMILVLKRFEISIIFLRFS